MPNRFLSAAKNDCAIDLKQNQPIQMNPAPSFSLIRPNFRQSSATLSPETAFSRSFPAPIQGGPSKPFKVTLPCANFPPSFLPLTALPLLLLLLHAWLPSLLYLFTHKFSSAPSTFSRHRPRRIHSLPPASAVSPPPLAFWSTLNSSLTFHKDGQQAVANF